MKVTICLLLTLSFCHCVSSNSVLCPFLPFLSPFSHYRLPEANHSMPSRSPLLPCPLRCDTPSVSQKVHTPLLSAPRKESSDATMIQVPLDSSLPKSPQVCHEGLASKFHRGTLAPYISIALLIPGFPKPRSGDTVTQALYPVCRLLSLLFSL